MKSTSPIQDNIIKNALIIILALIFYPIQTQALAAIQPDQLNNFLLIISMFLVTVCFANFAFTYEKSKMQKPGRRLLAHGAAFVFMLLIALLLESISLAVKVVYPSFFLIISGYSLLLYLGVVLFDFWDLLRLEDK